MKFRLVVALLTAAAIATAAVGATPAAATYRNPVIFADYSDPDVVRAGDDYFLIASSFDNVPGLPILHSRDLIHWSILTYAVDRLPSPDFDRPQHGNGLWAPSLRFHDGYFWIYVGDPDRGIFMTRSREARGPWEPLTLIKEAKGWIDPCPLWDDDGSMYLVHAWAKSRAGFNGVLTVNRMSADGRRVVDEGKVVFDGRAQHPTLEGPKFYKRNGWYYIFAPAGGVKSGWQLVLRSKNVFGPYEDKVVLDQGTTSVNGPHQGAWVESPDGASWFLHFQDRGAYGRIVHLQPMTWANEWPVIGNDRHGEGKGQPVQSGPAPHSTGASDPYALQTTDEFNNAKIGLQWQSPGNPHRGWWSIEDCGAPAASRPERRRPAPAPVSSPQPAGSRRSGRQAAGAPSSASRCRALRLTAVPAADANANLWSATNLLLQKFSAPAFSATTLVDASSLRAGERAGLVVMGTDYSTLTLQRTEGGLVVRRATARNADKGCGEVELGTAAVGNVPVQLRVSVTSEAVCRFSYSTDGHEFTPLGGAFIARAGRWIGAKVGVFAAAHAAATGTGHADFDWFRVASVKMADSASLVVAQDGSGDYRTIQEALDALPADDSPYRTILIRNGIYNEKVMITASHVALVGEDRDKTRIEYAELRRNFRASHADDWGAAVINIADGAGDVVIANLTVHNTYGGKDGDHDHQFAIRSMDTANRIAVLHANVIADGGDTLSLWNAESGLTYYADSYFEGWVDFVCPRGWAYITNSCFYGHNTTASIWHDGSKNKDQKLVIRHSSFDGVRGFALGRNHRDAQFYLLDAEFPANMADKPIYPSPAPDPRQWGERYYYSNAHRTGGDFPWFAENLATSAGSPRDEDINAAWTFGGRWDPATLPAVLPFSAMPRPENGSRWVEPSGIALKWTPGRNAMASRVYFGRSEAPELRGEQTAGAFATGALEPGKTYYWRVDAVTLDGVIAGPLWSFRADPRTIRIAMAGDSTMTEKSGYGRGLKGRVTELAAFVNLSRGGRSSKSFREEGHWADVLRHKPTHVLIQFGHNDVPGKGLARETTLPQFRANMARYVGEARTAGVKPILVTPLTRRNFGPDGRIHSDLTEYAAATRAVAAEKNVPLIDLHAGSIELLERLGPAVAQAISPLKTDGTIDKTHLNDAGSALLGALVAEELRRVVPDLAPLIRTGELPIPAGAWSARMAESVMKRTPDPLLLDVVEKPKWDYTQGLVLLAIQQLANRTGDERYAQYVKAYYDRMIDPDGTIHAYKLDEYSLDRVNAGKELFQLYAKTHDEKYRKAIETLRQQFRGQPRTSDGGFWHKKRYPHQIWLDGLYMGAPWLAQYAKVFNDPAAFDEVIEQFVLMEKHARDEKSGLLYHGWDESRTQKWADPNTGRSPAFWGRAMGWYAMGLVETLDYVPPDHPRRGQLIAVLERLADAIVKVQDPKSGVWWNVLDQPNRERNYLESSASAMFAFTLLKASRLGYIDARYDAIGRRAYEGILKEFIEVEPTGFVTIHRAIAVAGLGGDPEKERYRDGTYDYYVGEKIRDNDPKAVGPFIFASMEMEGRSE
jgi:rhamnogalacturonyl hydrolase YesR/beta-xylosidase/lysophospholipase L1-like esterase